MATLWQLYGNCMATVWQLYGNFMATLWLTDWLTDRMTYWLIYWLTDLHIDCNWLHSLQLSWKYSTFLLGHGLCRIGPCCIMKAPFLLTDWFGNHCGWLSGGGGCGEDVFLNLCMQDANSGMSTLGENSLLLNSTGSQGQSAESLNLQLSSINHATCVFRVFRRCGADRFSFH